VKFKFDPNQNYQLAAISSTVDLFDGMPVRDSAYSVSVAAKNDGKLLDFSELSIANKFYLEEEQLLENLKVIQKRNSIPTSEKLKGDDFTVEMETGTGKTYVYLRTIFELNKKYGLSKFIIVVPSIAIREGVKKSIEIMGEHLCSLYGNENYNTFVYDSNKLEEVRNFGVSNYLQIMIINIDALRGADRIIRQERDVLNGIKPIDYIRSTNPIIIIDEPQSVDNTDTAKNAIADLNPLFRLRYSATHIDKFNQIYSLGPVAAFDLGLVKEINVDAIVSEGAFANTHVRLLSIDNTSGLRAKVEVDQLQATGAARTTVTVKNEDDLYDKSNHKEQYRNGFQVTEINATPGLEYITFSGGTKLKVGEEIGGSKAEVQKAQIKATVREHLNKELILKDQGIKVLSLFFIDRVANYRDYNEAGEPVKGKFAAWFEEILNELLKTEEYKELGLYKDANISKFHNGYFSADKKGVWKDTAESERSQNSEDAKVAYELIMKDKETLLDPKEPLRFIFSHSALREGWDNPNVFQICTLNETSSEMKKRQEIGRGLRLPVNIHGERVWDQDINKLTVIANESYEDFVSKLQREYELDAGVIFGAVTKDTFIDLFNPENDLDRQEVQLDSREIFDHLVSRGYIDEKGRITEKYEANIDDLNLGLPEKYRELEGSVIDEINRHRIKSHIKEKQHTRVNRVNDDVYRDPDFEALWEKISQRTVYSVEFDTAEFTEQVVLKLRSNMPQIRPPKIKEIKVRLNFGTEGIDETEEFNRTYEVVEKFNLPDILTYIQDRTKLTRKTIFEILKQSDTLESFKINPQRYMDLIVDAISVAKREYILKGIQYEKINDNYEMQLIQRELEHERAIPEDRVIESNKSVYRLVEFDSENEKIFTKKMEQTAYVKNFVKLPKWFKVSTPLGSYNPDWAIVKEDGGKLYLVRETKGAGGSEFSDMYLRGTEGAKIKCAKKHFETIGVDYKKSVPPYDEIS